MLLLHLFLLNNILSNLFIVQENIKGSNAANRMVVEFQIRFIIEKIDNSIFYHASQKLSFVGGPIRYLLVCINAILSSSMHRPTHYYRNVFVY